MAVGSAEERCTAVMLPPRCPCEANASTASPLDSCASRDPSSTDPARNSSPPAAAAERTRHDTMRSSEAMELLGFPPYSRPSSSEVKAAYRKMVMKSHPDRFPEHLKSQAESKFKEIAEAYSCLKDGRRGSRMEVHVMRSGVPTGYGRSNRTLVKAPFLLIMFAAVSFGALSASRAYQRQKELCSSQNPFLP